jgi:hypothetical protein
MAISLPNQGISVQSLDAGAVYDFHSITSTLDSIPPLCKSVYTPQAGPTIEGWKCTSSTRIRPLTISLHLWAIAFTWLVQADELCVFYCKDRLTGLSWLKFLVRYPLGVLQTKQRQNNFLAYFIRFTWQWPQDSVLTVCDVIAMLSSPRLKASRAHLGACTL